MLRISHFKFLAVVLATFGLTVSVRADSLVYISNGAQFGTVNLSTGTFHQIGPDLSDASQGLGMAANGSLLTMGFGGYLDSINPNTGLLTQIGFSGLSDCSTPASPCAANSVNTLASFQGRTYATDFQNRLYSVNTATGAATSIGLTGMPAIPAVPLSQNPNGTFNIYDEAFFEANGRFYATFDAGTVDFETGTITQVIAGALYQIDAATAKATLIGPTVFGLGAAVEVNGTTYAFLNATGEIATFNLATGATKVIGSFDESAGIISAAVATPEPATFTIAGLGLAGLLAAARVRSRRSCAKA